MKAWGILIAIILTSPVIKAQKDPEGRRLIRQVIRNKIDYDRLYYKNCLFNIEYNGVELPEVKGNIKLVRDSAIQISIVPAFGIEAGRILLTRDSIFIINRLSRWYIAERLKDTDLKDIKRLKMNEIEGILLGNLPSRARWLLKKDSAYRLSEHERVFEVRTGKSGWDVRAIINNEVKKVEYFEAISESKERISLGYINRKNTSEEGGAVRLRGSINASGYKIDGNVRMKDPVEDKNFKLGAQMGRNYKRKSLNSLKTGK